MKKNNENGKDDVVESLQYIIANMATKEDTDTITKNMDAGFAKVDKRLTKVENRLTKVEEQLVSINAELFDIKQRLEALESKVDSQSGYAKEIDLVMTQVHALEARIKVLESTTA